MVYDTILEVQVRTRKRRGVFILGFKGKLLSFFPGWLNTEESARGAAVLHVPINPTEEASNEGYSGEFSDKEWREDLKMLDQDDVKDSRIRELEEEVRLLKSQKEVTQVSLSELADASNSIATSVELQSTRTSDSLALLASMTDRFDNSTSHLDTLTEEIEDAMGIRDEAKDKLSELYDSGLETEERIKSMSGTIDELKSMMKDVLNVLTFIDEVSSSTNILSLNASIEAARAGEAGLGFAVISQEIRRLATTTKDHSATIRDRLALVVEGVNTLSGSMDSSLESLYNQKRSASASKEAFAIVADLFDTVDQVSTDIKTSFDQARELQTQVVAALTSISEESESISAAAEQVSASMDSTLNS